MQEKSACGPKFFSTSPSAFTLEPVARDPQRPCLLEHPLPARAAC